MNENDFTSYKTVPKSDASRKKFIWKNITIGDLVFIAIFAIAAFAIPFPISSISWIVRIGICLAICGLCVLLLIRNKTSGLRYYQYIWLVLKYIFGKKNYFAKEIKKVSVSEVNKGYVKQTYKNQTMYVKAFKVYGFDLLNSDDEDKLYYINTYHQILMNQDCFSTLVNIKESPDWIKNIENISKVVKQLEQEYNSKDNKTEKELLQIKAKLNQLANLLNFYETEINESNHPIKSWYLFVYGSSIEELEKRSLDTYNNWSRLFHLEEQNLTSTVAVLSNIWEPLKKIAFDENAIKYEKQNETGKFNQIPVDKIKFYADQFKIGSRHYSIGSVSNEKFPLAPDLFWLNRVSQPFETTMIINISPIANQYAKRIVQKSINNSAYKEYQLSEWKNAVEKSEAQQQLKAIELVKENLGSNKECLLNANILFLTYGENAAKCKLNVSKLKTSLKNENMEYNPLSFRQKDFFANVIPNGLDNKIATESIVYPALPFAGAFPIMDSTNIDDNGCLLGTNRNGNPVVLDVNKRNSTRINSNGFILGNSGSGKTTTIKKIVNNHIANNGIAFIIDPEQDYVHLTKYYQGQIIDAANGNENRINPLQILLNEPDDELESTNTNLISQHITLFIDWIKLLNLNLNDSKLQVLSKSLTGLYQKFGLFEKDLYSLKPEDYPTFDDLIKHIEEEISYYGTQEKDSVDNRILTLSNNNYLQDSCYELTQVWNTLVSNFANNGIYSKLYNGYSTLKIGNDCIVDFDVKNLLAISNPNRKIAQMLLIIAYIQNAININGYSNNPKKALLVVDEAHLFIDADYPQVLVFLSQMSKRIRKRSGGVWISTQNPSDFKTTLEIERYAKSIIENAQYTIIQSLKPNDANAIVEMYKNTPNPITEIEKNFIQGDKKGRALVIISNRMRQCVDIFVSQNEFDAIGTSPVDKYDPSKIDLDIDFDDFELIKQEQKGDIIYGN